jgi:cell division protein FtsQ
MAAVAAPADKRFRRAQVKPARKRQDTGGHAWLAIRLVVVLALAGYGGWRGVALVLGAPALQVSSVTMRGNERMSRGEVLALVDGLDDANILTVDLDKWQTRLLASPWVEAATLRRVLPSRIDIELRERQPIGVARIAGALYLVDARGIVIDEYGPNYADLDLPVIDGLAAVPGDGVSAVDERRTRLAARLITALAPRPDLGRRVSQIDVSDAHDAVVILDGDTVMLRLGEDNFVERIQGYLDLEATLREHIDAIDYVDLRFDERLYVRPRERERRTSGAAAANGKQR